ncbi:GNAT family N-acetyltransferase [Noviherbaspirillum cavernae]|uniref:GNAT family N-acetyltransferase n=1 Tax=Noviherbaspirillum cavernae TaxID=2320862 RepID=A0A418WXU4_9BURK|nr:GNAT family N-acetyltransferase [Noviherbaspirillum cavernae]RJG05011.1 GNAT family N-acetyltransferase [Noviherbaspirillum cavernae]
MTKEIVLRKANAGDVAAMKVFIFEHGANQWNFLPEAEVSAHLAAIARDKTHAAIAEIDKELVGFVTYLTSRDLARYQSLAHAGQLHGYICEAVVHRQHAGKGIGARLLGEAIAQLAAHGCKEIYIERHEENLASGGMMRKAGFIEIDTFDDPERRSSGSRRTTVCRIVME